MKTIQLGNIHSLNNLILILNPLCVTCKQAYLMAKDFALNNMDVRIDVILAGSLQSQDEGGIISRQILSQGSDMLVKKAIDSWFNQDSNSMEKWQEKNNITAENSNGRLQMELHLRWLELSEITEAPIKFFNNSEIPKVYNTMDLTKLIKQYKEIGFANQE